MILRGLVAIAGITSASVVPDTYYQTKLDIAKIESENIPTSKLGEWLSAQHFSNFVNLMKEHGYEHILKKYVNGAELHDWYNGEMTRLQENLRKVIGTAQETDARADMENFRAVFHKPAIYAAWDWAATVEDALHQAGFANFEEQAKALDAYRNSH